MSEVDQLHGILNGIIQCGCSLTSKEEMPLSNTGSSVVIFPVLMIVGRIENKSVSLDGTKWQFLYCRIIPLSSPLSSLLPPFSSPSTPPSLLPFLLPSLLPSLHSSYLPPTLPPSLLPSLPPSYLPSLSPSLLPPSYHHSYLPPTLPIP